MGYKSISKRFWEKVDIKDENSCWIWKASTFGVSGYGQFWDGQKGINAHRMAWILTNGDILDNKLCLHKCDNRLCVNPNHLYLGTHSDNICDAIERKRGNFAFTREHIGYGFSRFKK